MSLVKSTARTGLSLVTITPKSGTTAFHIASSGGPLSKIDDFKYETGIYRAFKQEDARYDAITDPAKYKDNRRAMLDEGVVQVHALYTNIIKALVEKGYFPSATANELGLAVAQAALEAYKVAVNEIYPEDPSAIVSELSLAKQARREAVKSP